MYTVVYNEGLGFTEYKKEYSSLILAISTEGDKILDAHVYKNNKRIVL